uniref:Uncharacterized protein n=1 Tax=Salix viminalis TaxID=40686 RepID=A0A6N2LBD1_SALVM
MIIITAHGSGVLGAKKLPWRQPGIFNRLRQFESLVFLFIQTANMSGDTNQATLNSTILFYNKGLKVYKSCMILETSKQLRLPGTGCRTSPSYTGGSSTTASSDAASDFSSRRILFSDVCFSRLSLSVALCFDEGDDRSVIDSATVDGEGGGSSESLGGLVEFDKLLGESKALPAFCCSIIFCKYLACSSIRNCRVLCTCVKNIGMKNKISQGGRSKICVRCMSTEILKTNPYTTKNIDLLI